MSASWVVAVVGAALLLGLALWCSGEDREDRRYRAAVRAADDRYLAASAELGPEALTRAVADVAAARRGVAS